MENPIKIDDLGVPLFLETPIYIVFRGDTLDLTSGEFAELVVTEVSNGVDFHLCIMSSYVSFTALVALQGHAK